MPIEVIVLGSGTSHGVPMVGCDCAVCTSPDPHDKRTRPSIVVRSGEQSILVDATPELRMQCLDNDVSRVDAVLLTHHHADHVAGMDDLRPFNWIMKKPVAVYGTERTLTNVRRMFLYAFEPAPDSPHSRPQIELRTIDTDPFTIDQTRVTPIRLMHGPLPILGFRIGNFAYCTDCSHIPDESIERLRGLDVLILDALRYEPHPAHFSLDQAVTMAGTIGARQTFFTHIAHQMAHEPTNRDLPDNMALAYDGLRISLA